MKTLNKIKKEPTNTIQTDIGLLKISPDIVDIPVFLKVSPEIRRFFGRKNFKNYN